MPTYVTPDQLEQVALAEKAKREGKLPRPVEIDAALDPDAPRVYPAGYPDAGDPIPDAQPVQWTALVYPLAFLEGPDVLLLQSPLAPDAPTVTALDGALQITSPLLPGMTWRRFTLRSESGQILHQTATDAVDDTVTVGGLSAVAHVVTVEQGVAYQVTSPTPSDPDRLATRFNYSDESDPVTATPTEVVQPPAFTVSSIVVSGNAGDGAYTRDLRTVSVRADTFALSGAPANATIDPDGYTLRVTRAEEQEAEFTVTATNPGGTANVPVVVAVGPPTAIAASLSVLPNQNVTAGQNVAALVFGISGGIGTKTVTLYDGEPSGGGVQLDQATVPQNNDGSYDNREFIVTTEEGTYQFYATVSDGSGAATRTVGPVQVVVAPATPPYVGPDYVDDLEGTTLLASFGAGRTTTADPVGAVFQARRVSDGALQDFSLVGDDVDRAALETFSQGGNVEAPTVYSAVGGWQLTELGASVPLAVEGGTRVGEGVGAFATKGNRAWLLSGGEAIPGPILEQTVCFLFVFNALTLAEGAQKNVVRYDASSGVRYWITFEKQSGVVRMNMAFRDSGTNGQWHSTGEVVPGADGRFWVVLSLQERAIGSRVLYQSWMGNSDGTVAPAQRYVGVRRGWSGNRSGSSWVTNDWVTLPWPPAMMGATSNGSNVSASDAANVALEEFDVWTGVPTTPDVLSLGQKLVGGPAPPPPPTYALPYAGAPIRGLNGGASELQSGSIYWFRPVYVKNRIAGALGDYYFYWSTSHGSGGVWMGYGDSLDLSDITVVGEVIPNVNNNLETPYALWDPVASEVVVFAHEPLPGANTGQGTYRFHSSDGQSFTNDGVVIPPISGLVDEHAGWATIERVSDALWYAYHHAGLNSNHSRQTVLSVSTDQGRTWTNVDYLPEAVPDQPGRVIMPAGTGAITVGGEKWLVGVNWPWSASGGVEVPDSTVSMRRMTPDRTGFDSDAVEILSSSDIQFATVYEDDQNPGDLWIYYGVGKTFMRVARLEYPA